VCISLSLSPSPSFSHIFIFVGTCQQDLFLRKRREGRRRAGRARGFCRHIYIYICKYIYIYSNSCVYVSLALSLPLSSLGFYRYVPARSIFEEEARRAAQRGAGARLLPAVAVHDDGRFVVWKAMRAPADVSVGMAEDAADCSSKKKEKREAMQVMADMSVGVAVEAAVPASQKKEKKRKAVRAQGGASVTVAVGAADSPSKKEKKKRERERAADEAASAQASGKRKNRG